MARAAQQPPPQRLHGYIRDVPERPTKLRRREPPPEEEEKYEEEEQEIDIMEQRPSGHIPEPPLTKSGQPDRRFLGARHLPPAEEVNPQYRKARTGGMIGDLHITISGKPDRRFRENRGLSEDEVMAQWVETLNKRYRQH